MDYELVIVKLYIYIYTYIHTDCIIKQIYWIIVINEPSFSLSRQGLKIRKRERLE